MDDRTEEMQAGDDDLWPGHRDAHRRRLAELRERCVRCASAASLRTGLTISEVIRRVDHLCDVILQTTLTERRPPPLTVEQKMQYRQALRALVAIAVAVEQQSN